MAAASDYLENKVLDYILTDTADWAPAAVYLALFTAATGTLESNNPDSEVSGGSYARVQGTFGAAAAGTSATTQDATFTTASASWGTVSHSAVVDHASNVNWGTGVNVLFWGSLTQNKIVDNGDTFKFNAGSYKITLD